ncbi:S1 family peptidase [Actinokineospora spheciospongiae]|uniref:S1 family peptidase n=1 Tax=Actinokineospora spheciospongiae TaxID=909613 RepID=UPI000D7159E6|nr:S1 family peptidase [Actinokineospora spheciospongiae]PWW62519.1 trypsin [Actinokineospora spheciospongiae]
MKRSLVMRASASGLLLSGLLAAGAVSPAHAAPELSPGLVPAVQRAFGLTAEQAATRLAQEDTAARVEPAAKAAAGAAYGGSWFDPARGVLVVALTDQTRAGAVRATGAETTTATTSAARLDAAKAAVDALPTGAPAGVSGWRTDPRTGSVRVSVNTPGADVDAFLAAAGRVAPLTVAPGPKPTTLSAGTVGGDPYHINGNTRCSIGFSVHGGFVSAGHCGGAGSSTTGWDGSYLGNFAASQFPGDDMAFIRTGGGWWTVPVVIGWGQVSDQLVRGSNEAPVGASVCRSGSTSHWHCGTVLGKNETVNYAQGAFHGATRTNACAEPGDSGGSFLSGDQAQGVTSGGWGNCSSGGQTWFQPVNEILQRYGLTLHTA